MVSIEDVHVTTGSAVRHELLLLHISGCLRVVALLAKHISFNEPTGT